MRRDSNPIDPIIVTRGNYGAFISTISPKIGESPREERVDRFRCAHRGLPQRPWIYAESAEKRVCDGERGSEGGG